MLIFKKEKHARHLVLEHLRDVRECLTESRNTLEEYLSGDLENATVRAGEVDRLESAADDLLNQIREVLLDGAFLPNIRSDVYRLVEATDSIAGEAQDIAKFITCQFPDIPSEYHAALLEMFQTSLNCFFELRKALKAYFKPKGLFEDLREHFTQVGKIESEVDALQAELTKRVFTSSLDLSNKIHIQRLVRRIGQIADLSEDTADELEFAAMKAVV
jgi:predicted phosphate transport protein (TIGR00153 family)